MVTIDFHIHIAKREMFYSWVHDFQGRMNPQAYREYDRLMTPEGLSGLLEEAGVDYGVVLAHYSPVATGVIPNEYVSEFCKGSDRLIPFASINPYIMANPVGELEKAVEKMGMKGLKLSPPYQQFYPNDRRLYPVYSKADQLGITVMFHTGSSIFKGARLKYGNPLHIDDVAVDFPDLTLILVHGGRGFWYDEAFHLARIHSNVYLEVSGLPPQNLLEYFPKLDKIGKKVIFGSDWPGFDIRTNMEKIKQLPLSDDVKRKILGENAYRILRDLIPAQK